MPFETDKNDFAFTKQFNCNKYKMQRQSVHFKSQY